MRRIFFGLCIALVGCAKASTIPLTKDTLQITSSAAPVCGMTGAQNVALHQAAVETIRHGYDNFLIVGSQYQNNVGVVGYTPVVANTTGSVTAMGYGNSATAFGNSTTTYSGGQPIIAGTHNQSFVVKMFKDGDPAGNDAISAKSTLGPKWQEAVAQDSHTCL
ncbi:hypothetical protein [Hyphomicrobium sp. 2TAF46]|uniref:hypothetical protein n=1 Tax=Hyphomicrobium sp. 2TAF46 TaxID=3233019 RepID=UPI003F92B06A